MSGGVGFLPSTDLFLHKFKTTFWKNGKIHGKPGHVFPGLSMPSIIFLKTNAWNLRNNILLEGQTIHTKPPYTSYLRDLPPMSHLPKPSHSASPLLVAQLLTLRLFNTSTCRKKSSNDQVPCSFSTRRRLGLHVLSAPQPNFGSMGTGRFTIQFYVLM